VAKLKKKSPIFIQRQNEMFKNLFFSVVIVNCSAELRASWVFLLFNYSSNAEAIQSWKAHKNYHKLWANKNLKGIVCEIFSDANSECD
jgi:hypothetical protein